MTFFEKVWLVNINPIKKLSFFNVNAIKFDFITNSKIYSILNQFNFNKKDILMKMKTTCYNNQVDENKVVFKHFKEGEDEELRCEIQNSVFYDINRIPIDVDDISAEEYEDYYVNNFGVFICKDSGQAMGYGQIILNNGLYTIVNIGVLDKYRRKGYGELLVKYLIELCYKNSIKNVYIRVEKNNKEALSLYSKIGFKEYHSIVTWFKNRDFF